MHFLSYCIWLLARPNIAWQSVLSDLRPMLRVIEWHINKKKSFSIKKGGILSLNTEHYNNIVETYQQLKTSYNVVFCWGVTMTHL